MARSSSSTPISELERFAPEAYRIAKEKLDKDKSLAWAINIQSIESAAESEAQTNDADTYDTVDSRRIQCTSTSTSDNNEKLNYACIEIVDVLAHKKGASITTKVKVPITAIPRVDPEPPMTLWTKIPCNVRVRNDGCYINQDLAEANDIAEHEREKVREIVANSEKEYLKPDENSQIAKSVKVHNQLGDDQLFQEFVSLMMAHEGRVTKQKECNKPEVETSNIDKSSVFHAIAKFAPNVGFPFELRERYLRLITNGKRSKAIVPLHNLKRKDVMDSFHKNFCRRCYVYNCLLHDQCEMVPIEHMKPPPTDFQEDAFPCSASCYKNLRWKNNASSPPKEVQLKLNPQADIFSVSKDVFEQDVSRVGSSSKGKDPELSKDRNLSGYVSSDSDDSVKCISESIDSQHKKTFARPASAFKNNDIYLSSSSDEEESEVKIKHNLNEAAKLTVGGAMIAEDTHVSSSEVDTWNFDEVSIYLAMRMFSPNQYCYIANIIGTKTCQEVYRRAQSDPEKVEPDECYPLSGSKKKTAGTMAKKRELQSLQIKSFSHHCRKTNMILGRPKKPKVLPAYIPCYHPDSKCEPNICTCLINKIPCEKFCGCSSDCVNLYPGCQCNDNCDTKGCNCVLANRECDMDMCGCSMALARVRREVELSTCKNVNIQNGLGKKVERKVSKVAGWGLFAAEPIKENEYIGEYTGELISNFESDIRGEIYDKNKYTFLFGKDDLSTIDGMRFGNLTRFINSSSAKYAANCFPVSMTVCGNIRIGLFASEDIAVGEELLFDYTNVLNQQMIEQQPESSPVAAASTATSGRVTMKRKRSSSVHEKQFYSEKKSHLKKPVSKSDS